MNLKEIKELINLMNDNDLAEVELEREGSKIKLKKQTGEPISPVHREPISYKQIVPQAKKEEPEAKATNPNAKEIKSPMVGTFYCAPSPESPPFVEIGQVIEVGQVVCIVEAMKLMNEIKSEVRGKITEIPIENAQPVEFGQTLFVIEPV